MTETTIVLSPAEIACQERYSQLFLDYEIAKLELLKISQKVLAQKRAFFDGGISTPGAERSAMYAEQQRLEIVCQTLKIEAIRAKEAARRVKTVTFVHSLVEKCQAAGRVDLIEAARAESLQALEAAGLRDAYRMKGPSA